MSTRDILSNDELDALLDGVNSGDVSVESDPVDPKEVKGFDFSAREHSMLGQMPALQVINEKLKFGFTRGLNNLFNIPVNVNLASASVCRLADVTNSLPLPAGVNTLKLKPFHGTSLLTVPPDLLSFLVDLYFGSNRSEPVKGDQQRAITPTERRINELLVKRFLEVLQQSWDEFIVLGCEHLSFESNPDFIQIADPSELVVKISLEIKFAEWESEISLVIPYASLEPFREKLGSTITAAGPNADQAWSSLLKQQVMSVPLSLNGIYASCEMTLRELMALEAGDILTIEEESLASLMVEGIQLYDGVYGASQGKKSIQISQLSAAKA